MNAGGDYNLKVGGNYTVEVGGSIQQRQSKEQRHLIQQDKLYTDKTIDLNP